MKLGNLLYRFGDRVRLRPECRGTAPPDLLPGLFLHYCDHPDRCHCSVVFQKSGSATSSYTASVRTGEIEPVPGDQPEPVPAGSAASGWQPRPGDVVWLKSGGCPMVARGSRGDGFGCDWHDADGRPQFAVYPAALLTPEDPHPTLYGREDGDFGGED